MVNIACAKASSCFGVQCPADLRGRGLQKGKENGKCPEWRCDGRSLQQGPAFFDCSMLEIRKAGEKK